ncbi:uncharacterized protein GGS22DRAFT_69007 [Annulohypoxylon maeteangense]|uniref:uncharacterized protein n=1 Tax=Annulohypoxylon maeteangense TaxID=1927788 RepID=UPI002007D1D6|nr:uncharacterized protein GGS22DRAFT_69007 [Annulohypoxylon maeteangense]KAI0889239.1 hypothetical protein GGS22DRAFT_69007 [Annulohypoxylon maeteangense]
MAGTVIFTGANSSLGIPAVNRLLEQYPQSTLILTVRDPSKADVNTNRLRDVISQYPKANASIHQLDLADLSSVHKWAQSIAKDIDNNKYPPIRAIICAAYRWNLNRVPQSTVDGLDETLQISHVSHVALILRLIGKFRPDGGRVLLFSSDTHVPGGSVGERYPPGIPEDLNLLAKPIVYEDVFGRGFQNYGNTKLVITCWMYALNRYLQKDADLRNITAVAINPGNLVDSRALQTNTPWWYPYMQTFILRPFLPLHQLRDPTIRTAALAGIDVAELALNPAYAGERGFFTFLKKDQSSAESQDEVKQEALWAKSLEWAKITKDDTALKVVIE